MPPCRQEHSSTSKSRADTRSHLPINQQPKQTDRQTNSLRCHPPFQSLVWKLRVKRNRANALRLFGSRVGARVAWWLASQLPTRVPATASQPGSVSCHEAEGHGCRLFALGWSATHLRHLIRNSCEMQSPGRPFLAH